jgi:hypothetical protein
MFACKVELGYPGRAALRGNICAVKAQVAITKSSCFAQTLHKNRFYCHTILLNLIRQAE